MNDDEYSHLYQTIYTYNGEYFGMGSKIVINDTIYTFDDLHFLLEKQIVKEEVLIDFLLKKNKELFDEEVFFLT